MLFIDGKKSSVDDLIDLVNKNKGTKYTRTDLDKKFKRNPEFEVNPVTTMVHLGKSRQLGRKVYKEPKDCDILAYFKFYSPVSGIEHEVRYTDVMPHKSEKTGLTVYKPKALEIRAPFHTIPDGGNRFEKMLFFWLHPNHSKSPFHKPGSVYKYTHLDNDEKHEKIAKLNNDVLTVANHIKTLDPNELIIYAKTLGIDVQGHTHEEVRVIMQSKALSNDVILGGKRFVPRYLDILNNGSLVFSGYVQDAIDRKKIVSTRSGQSQVWRFDLPRDKRELCATSVGTEAVSELVAWIKSNPTGIVETILSINREINDSIEFEKAFDKAKGNHVDPEKFLDESDEIEFGGITSFKEASLFLKKYFDKNPSKKNAADFFKAIQSNDITEENWSEKILDYAPVGFVLS